MSGSTITASTKFPPSSPPWDEENSRSRPSGRQDGAQHGVAACTWPGDLRGRECHHLWPCYWPGHPDRGQGQCHRQAGDLSLFLTRVRSPRAAPHPNAGLWEKLCKATLQRAFHGVSVSSARTNPGVGREGEDKLLSHIGAFPHVGLQQPEIPAPIFLHSRPQNVGLHLAPQHTWEVPCPLRVPARKATWHQTPKPKLH